MFRSKLHSFVAVPLMLAGGTAVAQNNPVSEQEVKCFVYNCSNATTANAPNAAPRDSQAASQAAAPPAAGVARSKPISRPGTNVRKISAPPATRRSLDMRLSFDSGSTQLTPDARAQADTFAKVLKDSPPSTGKFVIEGHTDSVGSRPYNRALSQQRANSVVGYLVAQGVPGNRLRAVGYGFDHPRAGLSASDPSNRRVEIVKY